MFSQTTGGRSDSNPMDFFDTIFSDGTSLTGFFIYDADGGWHRDLVNWEISVASGNLPAKVWTPYSSWRNHEEPGGFNLKDGDRYIVINFESSLTNAGGESLIIDGYNYGGEGYAHSDEERHFHSGGVRTSVVPEPISSILLSLVEHF